MIAKNNGIDLIIKLNNKLNSLKTQKKVDDLSSESEKILAEG